MSDFLKASLKWLGIELPNEPSKLSSEPKPEVVTGADAQKAKVVEKIVSYLLEGINDGIDRNFDISREKYDIQDYVQLRFHPKIKFRIDSGYAFVYVDEDYLGLFGKNTEIFKLMEQVNDELVDRKLAAEYKKIHDSI